MDITSSVSHNERLHLDYVPINDVQSNPLEPRVYSRLEKRRWVKALQTYGALPIIVDQSGMVLSGNISLEASRTAGFAEVPVVRMHHLNKGACKALMLSLARLVERGKWDQEKLRQIFLELSNSELNFDLDITGFDLTEIDNILVDIGQGVEEELVASDLHGPSVSRPGYLWKMRDHLLLCGDARDRANYQLLMGSSKAALISADLPYNLPILGHVSGRGKIKHSEFAMASGEMSEAAFIEFLICILTLLAQYSVDGSLHFIAMDWRHLEEVSVAGRKVYDRLLNVCAWVKDNAGMGSLYRSQHELFFVFKNGKAPHVNNVQLGKYGRNRTNVWNYPCANSFSKASDEGNLLRLHPTVKPIGLVADILLDASKRNDLVLDPCVGSGTTLIAAEKVGRRVRGMEINTAYVDVAIRRWQRWTGENALLVSDGRCFDEIEALGGRGTQ